MKCDFCDNPKYVERLNNKGVLENYCVNCIEKLKRRESQKISLAIIKLYETLLQVLPRMKSEKLSIAKQKAYLASYIRDLKEKSPCRDCGKFYPYYVMDFDHVRGKKHANVMELIPTLSKKKIDEEIAKCEIVCSNCHRIRTHMRKMAKKGK